MSEWQPISDAPKDLAILLYGAKGRYRTVIGKWNDRFRQWQSEPGAWAIYPTHWMPLPASPTSENGS